MEYDIKENLNGDKFYYKKGADILHRENGPAIEYDIVVCFSGIKYFYKKGTNILHRESGPAVEFSSGTKMWYYNGKSHRINGPAIEWYNSDKEWWVDGNRISPEKETILNRWWNNKNGI